MLQASTTIGNEYARQQYNSQAITPALPLSLSLSHKHKRSHKQQYSIQISYLRSISCHKYQSRGCGPGSKRSSSNSRQTFSASRSSQLHLNPTLLVLPLLPLLKLGNGTATSLFVHGTRSSLLLLLLLLLPLLSTGDLVLSSELVEGVRAAIEESGEAQELRQRGGGPSRRRVHLLLRFDTIIPLETR